MLRDTRVSLGLTLQEVANTAKLSRFTIENAEKGKVISEVSAAKIVNALNILTGQTYTAKSLGIKTKEEEKADD